jgi:type II secretory pathway pseudopilin PulG
MLRVGLAIIGIALAGTAPALATSEQTDKSRESASTNSQGSQSASEESAGLQYVRSDCDVRRPSCRRWRALAGDRLEKSKGAD